MVRLAGRLVREHERRAPTVHDLRKVRALNSEAGVSAPGGGSGARVNDDTSGSYSAVGFMYKHRVLMNTLALAAAPGGVAHAACVQRPSGCL